MSEGLAQGSYVVARLGLELETFRTQGPDPTTHGHRRQSWGVGGRGKAQGGRGGREGVVKYYYSLFCRGSMFESDLF